MRRLVVLLVLVSAAPAQAVEVARTGDFVLHARLNDGQLCLSLNKLVRQGCQPIPRSPFQPLFITSDGRGGGPLGAAVVDDVASVRIGERTVETVSAKGFASRFFLATGVEADALIRFYDDAGELIGAARNESFRFRRSGDVLLQRKGLVRVTARRDFELQPDPLELDRTVMTSCLRFSRGGPAFDCRRDASGTAIDVSVDRGCAPQRGVLSGVVADSVKRVELLLGSGRTLRSASIGVPAPYASRFRLVAVSIPHGEAVRSVAALDSAGRTVTRRSLGAGPTGLPCEQRSSTSVIAFGGDFFGEFEAKGRGTPIARAGGRPLYAGDGKSRPAICVGFELRGGCQTAPVDAAFFSLTQRKRGVGGVVSKDVASVTLELDRGGPVVVETIPGTGYDGRYAGLVRFVAATLAPGRTVTRATARDADGHRLGRGFVEPDSLSAASDGSVAVAPGIVARSAVGFGRRRFACLGPPGVSGLAFFLSCSLPIFNEVPIQANATCNPRRLSLYGFLPKGVSGVEIDVTGPGTVPARVIRLPRRLGGGRVWSATLERDAGVRAVVFSDPLPRPFPQAERPGPDVRYVLPPVREQCGYTITEN